MNILWLIIKIVLWILLGVIGLVLVGLLLILGCPIKYEAYLSKEEHLTYDVRFRYLFGVKGLFYQDLKKKNHWISIFGKTLYKEEIEREDNGAGEVVKRGQEPGETESSKQDKKIKQTRPIQQKPLKNKQNSPPLVVEKKEKVNGKLKKEAEEEVKELGENLKQETEETASHMSVSGLKAFVLDRRTYGAIKEIVRCLVRILKGIAPKEWDFELVVGKKEPADTGELIAKLTMLYPIYYGHGIIRGNYEKECIEGGFLIKGKFTLGMIVWHIVRCLLCQPVRWLIKFIVDLRKEEGNGK